MVNLFTLSGVFYHNSLDQSISNSRVSGYCSFDIFQSRFLLGALHRSQFAIFCHDLLQNQLL